MKIIRRKNQNRRDFSADMECEGCGNKVEFRGYDDRFYHDNVLPKRKCTACGKSRIELEII